LSAQRNQSYLREVIFINQDVVQEFDSMPADVRQAVEARTTIIQNGGRLPTQQVRSLQGSLAGISEIRVRFDNDTYRVCFAAAFAQVVYLLDAGIKKAAHGQENTPLADRQAGGAPS
jgi:phage-related protein